MKNERGSSRDSTNQISDREKKRVLDDLRSSLNPGALPSDVEMAQQITRVSTNINHLASSATSTADIAFAVNLVDYTADRVATQLESSDPNRDLFAEACIADGISMISWLPGGYDQLEELSKEFIPLTIAFQKCVTIKDLVERRGDAQPTPIRDKKKRTNSQLSKAPTSAPKKIEAPEAAPSHKDNMEIALNVLKQHALESPVSFFKFVINPNSFVQTSYNIFIVSFLVHEQLAILSVGDNHELFIRCTPEIQDSQNDPLEGTSNIQLVVSLSPLEWAALVKHFNLTYSMLPEFCPKVSQYFTDDQLSEDLATGVTFLQP